MLCASSCVGWHPCISNWESKHPVTLLSKHSYAGIHSGDLEIKYEQGDLVYASLSGECSEVDVQLSQPAVSLQPTYINTSSQGTFR